jgi:hypothetical protein
MENKEGNMAEKAAAPKQKVAAESAVAAEPAVALVGGGVLVPLTPLNTLEPMYWQNNNSITGGQLIRGTPGLPIVQQTSEFIVSAAQLHALSTTPLQIVEAPGLGFALVPIFFIFMLRYAAPTYVNTTDGTLYVGWGDTAAKAVASPAVQLSLADLICSPNSNLLVQSCTVNPPLDLGLLDNRPLTLATPALDTLSAGGGHLHFIVEYAIVATTT